MKTIQELTKEVELLKRRVGALSKGRVKEVADTEVAASELNNGEWKVFQDSVALAIYAKNADGILFRIYFTEV